MTDAIRVGLIGASPSRGWAMRSHLPVLQALPGFELSAVATTRQESADASAKAFGARYAFSDPLLLVQCDDVDVVTISVKVWYHRELTKLALQAGKHVYTEWPLGVDTDQANELLALAKSKGVSHVVGLQGRKSPLLNYVRDLVAEGFVGRVLSSTLSVASSGRGGTRIPDERVWSSDKSHGSTLLSIVGGHSLDVLRYVLGEFDSVSGLVATQDKKATVIETGETIEVSSPDNVLLTGQLQTGALVAARFLSVPRGSAMQFAINGDNGSLLITSDSGYIHLADTDLVLKGAQAKGELSVLEVPARYRLVDNSVPTGAPLNVAGLYEELGASIRNGTTVDPSFATAIELHRLIDAIELSSQSGVRTNVASASSVTSG